MPIQGLTREAITEAIGYNLMGAGFISSTTTSAGGDTSSVIDTLLEPVADYHNGRWLVATSGTNDGEVTRVNDDNGAGDLTVSPVFTATVPLAMTYQLWKTEYPPRLIYEFINQSIVRLSRRVYDPEEDQSLHLDGKTSRLDIPTEFDMIQYVYHRSMVRSLEVHGMESTFDETTDSDFTQTADTEDKKLGNSSLKIVVAAAASAADVISDSITSVDLSSYTHLEGWVKCTTTLSAGDWRVHLDDATITAATISAGSVLESLSVPAVAAADTWQFFSIALANPETDTAIISVALEMVTDGGAYTIWFDDLHVVEQDTAIWTKIPRNTWWIDHEQRDLILRKSAVDSAGYSRLKLVGGGLPVFLNTNATVSEVDEYYIIAWTTAMALSQGGSEMDAETRANRIRFWFNEAERAQSRFPALVDVRPIG